jgi:hypothetical protein
MRTMMLITILVLMTTMMAKAEETINKDEAVKQVTKVKNFVVNEWTDIKEYQKANWQAGKEQNAKNWSKIKSFFSNLTGQNNATQD